MVLISLGREHSYANPAPDLRFPVAGGLGSSALLWPVSIIAMPWERAELTSCSKYSRLRAFLTCAGTTALFGGIEALLIFTLRVCPRRIIQDRFN